MIINADERCLLRIGSNHILRKLEVRTAHAVMPQLPVNPANVPPVIMHHLVILAIVWEIVRMVSAERTNAHLPQTFQHALNLSHYCSSPFFID